MLVGTSKCLKQIIQMKQIQLAVRTGLQLGALKLQV